MGRQNRGFPEAVRQVDPEAQSPASGPGPASGLGRARSQAPGCPRLTGPSWPPGPGREKTETGEGLKSRKVLVTPINQPLPTITGSDGMEGGGSCWSHREGARGLVVQQA